MEHGIDQTIELIHNNETIRLKTVEKDGCISCFFYDNKFGNTPCTKDIYHLSDAYCSKITRSDKKNIIYKQIK